MPVFRPKQSDSAAATLYSPPETWTSNERALRKGIAPGSSRWISAPSERKSRAHASLRIWKPGMIGPKGFSGHTVVFYEISEHAKELWMDQISRPMQCDDDHRDGMISHV